MKCIFTALFLVVLVASCSSKGTPIKPLEEVGVISGKLIVYDEYGEQMTNLSGFKAMADNGNKSTTDIASDGSFKFKNLPTGTYNITAVKEGYFAMYEKQISTPHITGAKATTVELIYQERAKSHVLKINELKRVSGGLIINADFTPAIPKGKILAFNIYSSVFSDTGLGDNFVGQVYSSDINTNKPVFGTQLNNWINTNIKPTEDIYINIFQSVINTVGNSDKYNRVFVNKNGCGSVNIGKK